MNFKTLIKGLAMGLLAFSITGCGGGSGSSSASADSINGAYFLTLKDDTDAPILVVVNGTDDVYASNFDYASGSYLKNTHGYIATIKNDSNKGDLTLTVNVDENTVVVSGLAAATGTVVKVSDVGALAGDWTGSVTYTAASGDSDEIEVNGKKAAALKGSETKNITFTVESTGKLTNIAGDLTSPFTGGYAFMTDTGIARVIIRTAATDKWLYVNLGTGTDEVSTSVRVRGNQVELDVNGSTGTFDFTKDAVEQLQAPQAAN